MTEVLDIIGASGAVYRFRRHREDENLPAMAGNVVYVRETPSTAVVVGCEELDTLREAYARWGEARDAHGASAVFFRLNVGRVTRRQESADIIERHRPPMNDTGPTG